MKEIPSVSAANGCNSALILSHCSLYARLNSIQNNAERRCKMNKNDKKKKKKKKVEVKTCTRSCCIGLLLHISSESVNSKMTYTNELHDARAKEDAFSAQANCTPSRNTHFISVIDLSHCAIVVFLFSIVSTKDERASVSILFVSHAIAHDAPHALWSTARNVYDVDRLCSKRQKIIKNQIQIRGKSHGAWDTYSHQFIWDRWHAHDTREMRRKWSRRATETKKNSRKMFDCSRRCNGITCSADAREFPIHEAGKFIHFICNSIPFSVVYSLLCARTRTPFTVQRWWHNFAECVL